MRSTPLLPLAMPEADPEEIIRKGKTAQKGTSTVVPSFSDNLHNPSLQTPVTVSDSPIIQTVGVSRNLNFGSFPADFSPPILGLEGESFDTPFSPEVVKWFRPRTLEDFPTPDFTTPPPIRVVAATEGETFVPSSPLSLSPRSTVPVSPVQSPPPLGSPPVHIPMAGANPPRTRMEAIVAARFTPLILPQPLNALPADGYLKQFPKFTGEGDITAEGHLEAFYSFTDNHAIENEDVWMRIFVHSLDGEARKWFRALPPGSIDGIEALDEAFLKNWGDKKYFLYYITEFGSLKKEEGNLFLTSQRGLIKCITKFPLRLSLQKPLQR
jgi:hypothetical protein